MKHLLMVLVLSPWFVLPAAVPAALPTAVDGVPVDDEEFHILYELVDTELQAHLEGLLNDNPQWRRLVSQKRLAVGLVDLSGNKAQFARVNGNVMMYAASMPKIAILLAAYASFEDGSLGETADLHHDLADMIRISSNAAATRMINRIGFNKINGVLSDRRYGLYDETRGGGLWVGKRYASTGGRQGDPLFNISHGATVTQVCRFYYLLDQGRLINPERSRQMLADLSNPGLHHKFVGAIDKLAPRAKLYRKSGTWRTWHADSILVRGPEWRNYILVAIVDSPEGESIIRQILPAVETNMHRSYGTAAG